MAKDRVDDIKDKQEQMKNLIKISNLLEDNTKLELIKFHLEEIKIIDKNIFKHFKNLENYLELFNFLEEEIYNRDNKSLNFGKMTV